MSSQGKNTSPLWIDTFPPSSYKHLVVWNSFKFQQKVDTVWNYQVKSYKRPYTDFFKLFIVTNWRLCVSKLLVLVKFLTVIWASSTSLIKSFSFSSVKKSRSSCTFFISHLLIRKRNDNVVWLAAFLKKPVLT